MRDFQGFGGVSRIRSGRGFVGGVLATLIAAVGAAQSNVTINGFSVVSTTIPAVHIKRAGPERDFIPALDAPAFVPAATVDWLTDDDEVLSVTVGDETRAYPLRILVWHEIINDTLGTQPLVVTYSALTGSAVAFDPGQDAAGVARTFGVSGLLYNSGLLMYDRGTECLWSQLRMTGVSGDASDVELTPIASRRLKWSVWKTTFPDGSVLSKDTGHDRDYGGDWPYGDYSEQRETQFPFDINRDDFETKERVIGLAMGGMAKCWPLESLKTFEGDLYDYVGARMVQISYDAEHQEPVVVDGSNGERIPVVSLYWFAWQAFYPDTVVWLPLD